MTTRIALALLAAMLTTSCGSTAATSPSPPDPTTFSWTSVVNPGGSAAHSFSAGAAGAVTVTLQVTAVPLGLGIGIPRATGNGCLLSVSLDAATASSTLTTPVDGGDYCVEVYEEGRSVTPVGFVLTVVHP
jgi:hypothetical protein